MGARHLTLSNVRFLHLMSNLGAARLLSAPKTRHLTASKGSQGELGFISLITKFDNTYSSARSYRHDLLPFCFMSIGQSLI